MRMKTGKDMKINISIQGLAQQIISLTKKIQKK